MAETVGQHSVAAFTSPVNGTSPIDANTVKGNDNTIRSAYVDHDADPGIHVQSSTLASRPVANSAGRKWMTQDSGVIRLFYDDGTSWYEVDYLRTTGGTISGNLAITGTLAVTGVATFTAQPILSSLTASRAVFTDGSKGLVSNAITGTGDVVMSASPTLTGTITAASATLSGTLGVSGLLTFASLKGTGATTVTNILDEDNMASDSATALATQQSIKAYVDAQVGASDALSEVLAIGNTTGANDIIVSAGQKIRTPAVAAQDGSSAITIANTTGALTLATGLADSNLATISTAGKVSNSATTATSANTASAIVARDASGNFTAGTVTAALSGNATTATTADKVANALTAGTYLTSGGTFDGAAARTFAVDATSANTASKVVARDASGNFSAGTITAALSGNASTATTLQTARNINGVSFNGSADITVTAAAGTLTGSTLASGVTASSLTSVGTLANLTVTNPISGSVTGSSGSTTGNAATATALQTARSINGVSFNGTADITVTAAAGTLSGSTLASGVTASSLTSVGTLSSLTVSGDLTVDTSTLKVDSTNNRVGIGTASPASTLEINVGGTNNVRFASASNFGMLSFNGNVATSTAMGIFGGASGDADLYYQNATGGGHRFRIGTGTVASIDSSGNLGIGVTPSAWDTAVFRTVQVGSGVGSVSLSGRTDGGKDMVLGSNMYYGTGNFRYVGTGVATSYRMDGGVHSWLTAASGTAGNIITFTQAMTLDASGNLGIGITSPATTLDVRGTTSSTIRVGSTGNGGSGDEFGNLEFYWADPDAAEVKAKIYAKNVGNVGPGGGGAADLLFATRPAFGSLTERARITAGGYFKASNTGTYDNATGTSHELRNSANDNVVTISNTSAATPYGISLKFTAAAPDNNNEYFLLCADNVAQRCIIYSDGDLANHDGVYGTLSDAKLKQDIVDAGSQWDDLKAVRFRKYRMKSDVVANPDAPFMLGVVAQELEAVSPGLVDEHPDFEEREVTDEDGSVMTEKVQVGTTKTVKSSILLMKAAVALQEAMARIEALEARLAALEA